jgi:hypothetical protein
LPTPPIARAEHRRAGKEGCALRENEVPRAPTADELEAQQGVRLPKREAMSLVDANMVGPVDAAIAVNVLTDDSVAVAHGAQEGEPDQ